MPDSPPSSPAAVRVHGGFAADGLSRFETDGYVVARGLFSAERCVELLEVAKRDLARLTEPIEYEADVKYPGAPSSVDAPGGKTARRLLQAYSRDERFAQFATDAAIVARLEQLLGPATQLSRSHHNCVMTKNPRYSSVTHWHQDIRYWSFERPELISVWIALGREYMENGCLLVLPGSHAMTFARENLDDALFLRSDLPQNRELIATQRLVELEPGDVLFFHCRLLHAAGRNQTNKTKFSVVFTYHAADNRPLPGTRSAGFPDVPL